MLIKNDSGIEVNEDQLCFVDSEIISKAKLIDLNKTKEMDKKFKITDVILKEPLPINLSKEELIKLCFDTKLGQEIKDVTINLIYVLGNDEKYAERELTLKVILDYDNEHYIELGKMKMLKKDFLSLYDIFDLVISKAVSEILEKFKEKEASQIQQLAFTGLADDFKSMNLGDVKIKTTLYNSYKDEWSTVEMTVSSLDEDRQALKFSKSLFSKIDLYMIYNKFDQIIKKAISEVD